MNRLDMTRNVLKIEAARDALDRMAKAIRDELNADARAEYEEQGSAQTWRFDIGTWSQGVSKPKAVVAEPRAFMAWVKERYPSEVVEAVNSAFQGALLERLSLVGELVMDPSTGEVVPGLGVRPGGKPQSLRFLPAGDAQAVADQMADKLVAELTAGLGIGGAE